MQLTQLELDAHLTAIRACKTWESMDVYLDSLDTSLRCAIYSTISQSPVLTKLDVAEMYKWYDCNKTCPIITRPKIMMANKDLTAWRFRLSATVDTRTFGGTFDDALKYFEFGLFSLYPTGTAWSNDDKKTLYYAWLQGTHIIDLLTTTFWDGTEYQYEFDHECIREYLSKIPKKQLFSANENLNVAGFTLLLANVRYRMAYQTSRKLIDRMTLYISKCLERGVNFAPFCVQNNPVWSFRHIHGIRYHENEMLHLEKTRLSCDRDDFRAFIREWSANPNNQQYINTSYRRERYSSYSPYVKKILLVAGCIGNIFRLHKDLRQTFFEMIVSDLYAKLDAEYDDVRTLENYYFHKDPLWIEMACLNRFVAAHCSNDIQCSMLALSILKSVNLDSRERYISSVCCQRYFLTRPTLGKSSIQQREALARQCYDNRIAITLAADGLISLDADFRIVNIEDAIKQTSYILTDELMRVRILLDPECPSEAKRIKYINN